MDENEQVKCVDCGTSEDVFLTADPAGLCPYCEQRRADR